MKLTERDIQINTKFSTDVYEKMKKSVEIYEKDEKKNVRIESQLCKTCFYLRKPVTLKTIFSYTCTVCEKEETYHNSNTPKYCKECASTHDVCVKCGSTV